MAVGTWVVTQPLRLIPSTSTSRELGRRVQQTFHGLASAQGIKGQEEGEAKRKAAKDQDILLPWGHSVDTEAEIQIFVEAAGFGARADVAESGHPAPADRTTKRHSVEIFESRAGFDANLFDSFLRVVDVAAAATFETVSPWVALWSGFDRWLAPPLRSLRPAGRTVVRRSPLCCLAAPTLSATTPGSECQTAQDYGDFHVCPARL